MIPSTSETVSILTLIPQEAGVGGYWPLVQGWAQGRKGPNWERRFRSEEKLWSCPKLWCTLVA